MCVCIYTEREVILHVCLCVCVHVHLTLDTNIFPDQFKSKLPNYHAALKENSRFTLCGRQKKSMNESPTITIIRNIIKTGWILALVF